MYNNFLDLESSEQGTFPVHVWPVPYQGTVSFGDGTKNGPEAILKASYQIEPYDPELDTDISRLCFFKTLPFHRVSAGGPGHLYQEMKDYLSNFDPGRDFFLTLGGEHSITYPLVDFYARKYPDLAVIQLDAHADLRPEFEGSPYSHACVMARIRDLGLKTVQMGIRSLDKGESLLISSSPEHILPLYPWDLPTPEQAASRVKKFIGTSPVYVSFDADGLDPSIMPGTGTPEPGGLSYGWVKDFWKALWPGPRLVGMDFCELSPLPGSVVSESVAVKSILKILATYFSRLRE
ncbi:agmatinase [Desulfonatronovibrio hydrogenovorans]|uniref:agmatinase n=1 Tax=Desulfonatronovibrio hydrogenovorans TaxID=53245 RepID=UPI0004915AF2|nr:agmatinase [Desulfonatronovibrio hydrogenovorans]